MAKVLSGKPVAAALCEKTLAEAERLKASGVEPTLCVVRLGEDPSDLSYERGIMKRAASVGVSVRSEALPLETSAEELIALMKSLSADKTVHGVLMFRPLPRAIRARESEIIAALDPRKDVDGMTDGSAAGVYLNKPLGYAPCTPNACIEILDYYGIDPTGKRAVVIGRSAVVGKPAAMLLLSRHATVTICHTRTKNLPEVAREAEILVAAAGRAEIVTGDHIAPGAIVLDVGVNWSEEKGKCVGDVLFDDAQHAEAVTPVPGGVGAVTTAILLRNVVNAAKVLTEGM